MIINTYKVRKISGYFLLSAILLFLIWCSCTRRTNRLDHKDLIPEEELVSILSELYLADGLLNLPKTYQWITSLDSSKTYLYIIEQHGYSKATMDKTMKYYFIKNPKYLIKIYDQVLGILSEIESNVEKEVVITQNRKEDIWKGNQFFSFPDPSGTDSSSFDITLNNPGLYTLSFTATLLPDDQSVNCRLTAFTCHPDSLETGKRIYLNTLDYLKDGQHHNYYFTIRVPDNTKLHLRGNLYDFDNSCEDFKRHARFENFSIAFIKSYV